MKNVLFLCVANSARSQMAEGLARHLFPEGYQFQSAGSRPSKVNPWAIKVLSEKEIDITQHTSTSVEDVDTDNVDLVITLCEDEVCPAFLGMAQKLHWPFEDPAGSGTDQELLERFRRIRDQISSRLPELKSIVE